MKMIIPKAWVGKKMPTKQEYKEAHKKRKRRKELIYSSLHAEWEQMIKEYNASK